jgi:hypothetical protein
LIEIIYYYNIYLYYGELHMERMELINSILDLEWEMFTNVSNACGRASCQDDRQTFIIMRRAQASIWSINTLESYLKDLKNAEQNKINLMSVKYAHMMETAFPLEYEAIKNDLPLVSQRANELAGKIMKYHSQWAMEASGKYPVLFSLGRPVAAAVGGGGSSISIDNYLYSELLTYSEATLELCLNDTLKAASVGVNLSIEILRNTAESYGYQSLDEIEGILSRRRIKKIS